MLSTDLTFLCFFWYLTASDTRQERKTSHKKQNKSHPIFSLKRKRQCSQSEGILSCGSAVPYLRSGSTQSRLFQQSVFGPRLPQQLFSRFLFCLFFKLQFTIQNNILYCDTVHIVYKLFRKHLRKQYLTSLRALFSYFHFSSTFKICWP